MDRLNLFRSGFFSFVASCMINSSVERKRKKTKYHMSWLITWHCLAISAWLTITSKNVLCSPCSRSFPTSHRRFLVWIHSKNKPGRGGENIYFGQHMVLNFFPFCTDSGSFNLNFRLHLGQSLEGFLGRGDRFPIEEKRYSHCVALVRVHSTEFHHLVLSYELTKRPKQRGWDKI